MEDFPQKLLQILSATWLDVAREKVRLSKVRSPMCQFLCQVSDDPKVPALANLHAKEAAS